MEEKCIECVFVLECNKHMTLVCNSEDFYENHSDGFVWDECDHCGYKLVKSSPGT